MQSFSFLPSPSELLYSLSEYPSPPGLFACGKRPYHLPHRGQSIPDTPMPVQPQYEH